MLLRQRTTFQGYSWGPVSLPPAILEGLLTSPHSHPTLDVVVGVVDVVVGVVVVVDVVVVVVVVGGQNGGQTHPRLRDTKQKRMDITKKCFILINKMD